MRTGPEMIAELKHNLEEAKMQHLTAKGWKYTCKTPGSYWLWEKTLKDGRTVLVNIDMALAMQYQLRDWMPRYKDAVAWLVDNDPECLMHAEQGSFSVTACLVIDLWKKTGEELIRDFRYEWKKRQEAQP